MDGFSPKEDAIVTTFEGPTDIEFHFNPARSNAGDVLTLKARRFGELVKRGVKPFEAAHSLHTSVRKLMEKPQTQAIITEIVEGYNLDPKVRALLVRSMQNKMLLQADAEGDKKTALDVMRQMMDDSELGMKNNAAPPAPAGLPQELKDLLDRTVPKELPAPVEAEFEDIKQ